MIEELKRFLLVASIGNVTRASERLFITQSALTQSIQRLEKELQTKLFQQKGKQLYLTQDGKSLAVIGEKMLKLWENAHDPTMRSLQTTTYTIGMFDNVALRLGTFLKDAMQNDTYHLELTIDSSGKLLTQLQLGTLDAAICIFNKTYQIPGHISLVQSYVEKLIPVSSNNYTEPIDKIPFILYNRNSYTRSYIDDLFVKNGIQPTIYAESTSVTFMRELALLGSGVALLPENFVQQDLNQGRLKKQKMLLGWQRSYGIFAQKGYEKIPIIKELQKALNKFSKV